MLVLQHNGNSMFCMTLSQSNDIPFLLREVRGRVGNFATRTSHLEQLQHLYLVDYQADTQTMTLTYRVGVVATLKLTIDYPQVGILDLCLFVLLYSLF